MREIIKTLFEVTNNTHYVKYNELVEIARNYDLDINKLCCELCQLKGVELKWSSQRFKHRRIYGLKIKEETTCK